MSIFTQHSYGKSDKIDTLIEKGLTSGVILSPKGESTPAKMIEVVEGYSSIDNLSILFDPHFHLGQIENCPDSKIKDYPYYKSNLKQKDFISPKQIIEYVSSTLNFQKDNLSLSGYISPTCIIESFENCLAAMSMAQCALEYAIDNDIEQNLYVSFVISENAFRGSKEALDDFITNITGLDNIDRIYLIIDKNSEAYSQHLDSDILQNILYFIYSLTNRNNIEIICGYTDLIGILYMCAGANTLATGWSQKTRFFSRNNYKEMTGGSTPKQRYTSIPLLNSIFNIPELQTIERLGFLNEVLSKTNYDSILLSNVASDTWNRNISFYHHMECINKLVVEIEAIYATESRIDVMLKKIQIADELYVKLKQAGVQFDANNNNQHLNQWKKALENLKEMII